MYRLKNAPGVYQNWNGVLQAIGGQIGFLELSCTHNIDIFGMGTDPISWVPMLLRTKEKIVEYELHGTTLTSK
jgi:hypothetical protein